MDGMIINALTGKATLVNYFCRLLHKEIKDNNSDKYDLENCRLGCY